MAVPYDETINMLMGTAIRYMDKTEFGDRKGEGAGSLRKEPDEIPRGTAAALPQ